MPSPGRTRPPVTAIAITVVYVPQYNPQVVYTQAPTTVVVVEDDDDSDAAVAAGVAPGGPGVPAAGAEGRVSSD